MTLPRLDHLILLVADIAAATATFTDAGFTVRERADTKPGSTLSRFVLFADGSYIQIAAFRSSATIATHRLGAVMAAGGGWADYSFAVEDLDAAADRGRAAGVVLGAVHEVGNSVVGQGDWSLRLLLAGRGAGGDDALPFLVQDVAGRAVRVPPAPDHANGAIGIASLAIASPSPTASAAALRALLGQPAGPDAMTETATTIAGCRVRFEATARPMSGPVVATVACGTATVPVDVDLGGGSVLRLGPEA